MNKRQAKKRYKKIHGCNPPKTASEKWRQGAVKSYNYDPEALQMAADGMRKAFREAGETIQRVAESFKKAFNEAGKKYRIETDDPPVVVARAMSERRKKCRRKLWSESPICSGIRSSGRFPGQIRGQNLRTGQSDRYNHGQRDTGRNRNGYQRAHGHDIHSKRDGRCAVSGGRLDVGGQQYEKCKGIQSNPGRNL